MTSEEPQRSNRKDPCRRAFVDLFAGVRRFLSPASCSPAGTASSPLEHWNAIAFQTLKHNLASTGKSIARFVTQWPEWLEKTPIEISQFIKQYHGEELRQPEG